MPKPSCSLLAVESLQIFPKYISSTCSASYVVEFFCPAPSARGYYYVSFPLMLHHPSVHKDYFTLPKNKHTQEKQQVVVSVRRLIFFSPK